MIVLIKYSVRVTGDLTGEFPQHANWQPISLHCYKSKHSTVLNIKL